MLEAAIIQKRRLYISCQDLTGQKEAFQKVLPVAINTSNAKQELIILTTDNEGGILKIAIETSHIISFQAKDLQDPKISFKRGISDN